ncbi:hypothetical protein WMY93_008035 [Mugilogobius chulae]|uniref:Uncharacterized protein n=1 Tax=Mugilogobius chulae TaxID=88201 RepID=A0AAW0PNL8_9GOBI
MLRRSFVKRPWMAQLGSLGSVKQFISLFCLTTGRSQKAMVLDRKKVPCPLQVGGEPLPQVEEYLGVLFTSEGRMEREIDRRIGTASAVMQSLYRTVVVKKELSRKCSLQPGQLA